MNDVGHKMVLSPVPFSHVSDSSASTKADVYYKVLYMNFVERLGDRLFQDLKSRFFVYIAFFSFTDKRRTDTLVCFSRLSKGYNSCDRLSSSCQSLLNLPTRGVRRKVG